MSSSADQPVVWDKRGIRSPHLIPQNIDQFVRAQIKQQIATPANVVYQPVSYEATQEIYNTPGPSSTGLLAAPFIAVVTFIKIANQPGNANQEPAGVILKDAKKIIGLTPGQTYTPSNMIFSAAIFPPNSFEPDVFDMDDPTHHIGLIAGSIQIEYLISYWKKTQI
ncbi:hypothetical protein MVEN_01028700 [Mycena venus]|uniref:Uncharacterized protein n=1 Tax=Mycena venus TaxID=2733690 RepID=A0A8H6Y9L7_9AGAR|nr:hypothetical protein MVEN_01028700 [Mycena venus]